MAITIKLKRSDVPGKIPLLSDLALGELALNTYDGKLYLKKNDGTESIVQLGERGYTGSIGYAGSRGATGYSGSQGGIGYTGSAGVISATAPITYNSATQTVAAEASAANTPNYLVQRDADGETALSAIQFDVTADATNSVGKLAWDNLDGTLKLGLTNEVVLQLGQETLVKVHNAENTTLQAGEVVYIYGSTGNRLSVKRASSAYESTSTKTLGVVTETISANSTGFVTARGIVHDISTDHIPEGTVVWLGETPGTFTATKPSAPLHMVFVGVVLKSSTGNGSLFVSPQNGYELDELHNVLIATLQDGDVLAYDSATGLWKNTQKVGYTGSRGVTGYTGSQGATGYVGSTGYTGSIGFTGSKGADGVIGRDGYTGSAGYVGSQGTQGYTGSIGFTGSKGADGVIGRDGYTGSAGYVGSQGSIGFTGSIGLTGSVGYTGSIGLTGSIGYTGSKGADGVIGRDGYTGSVGYAGSQGTQGYSGSIGYTGSTGFAGSVGYTGSQGVGLSRWTYVSSNITASALSRYAVDTTSGALTLTLPSTPVAGDWIILTDAGDWAANTLTIARNGNTIENYAYDMVIDVGSITVELTFVNNTWQVVTTLGTRGYTGSGGGASTAPTFTANFLLMGA